MASSRARLGDAVTPGLAGLSIAAGITREAVAAVPVVKQVLGVIVRILALAEKIDQDRDALHELVKKSVQLAERVKAVLGDRTGDEVFQPSIDRIRGVFEEIAEYMQKHVSRSRLSRTFGYVFTVKLHVDRLSRKLEDAVQELFMVAHITTTLTVHDGARFHEGFRLLHHCEVDKLDQIHGRDYKDADGNAMVQYHRARVDGTLLVVRYFTGSGSTESDRQTYESILSYDRALEELSTVQRSHPNVARIYGRSTGSIHDRFTVLKSGCYTLTTILDKLPDPTTSTIQWACKVLDAVAHLRALGISWKHYYWPPYSLDEYLEPMIGLENELRRIHPEIDPLSEIADQIRSIVNPLRFRFPAQVVRTTDVRAALADFHNKQLIGVLGKYEAIHRLRVVIPKCSLLNGFAVTDGTAERLFHVLEEDVFDDGRRVDARMWANILLALDKNRSHRLGFAAFILMKGMRKPDWLMVYGLAENSERIVYDTYILFILDKQRNDVRAMLGIPAPSEGPDSCRMIATGGPGTYRAPE